MSCQQFELYAAEGRVRTGARIARGELQEFVDQLRENPWWERNFPQVRRIETFVRGPRAAAKGSVGSWYPQQAAGLIEMAPVHLNELFIIHEVCHVLAAARYDSRAHDPWFARTYLEAVYSYMGPRAYAELLAAFTAADVDHDTYSSVPGGVQL